MIELLQNRRSIRKYLKRQIPSECIEKIIKAALMSPSSHNSKPWEFITVSNPDMLDLLSRSKVKGIKFLKDAALGIVVLADTQKSDVWIEDASIASIILHLTAESLQLGSCWIQLRNRKYDENLTSDQYIKNLLCIPDHYQVEAIIAMGYPTERKPPIVESQLLWSKVHGETFGKPYLA